MSLDEWIAEGHYFLHVHPDGREERFLEPQDDRAMATTSIKVVEVDGEVFEETLTRCVRPEWIPIWPRGAGWKAFDQSSDHWVLWRRKIREVAT